ncbi:Stealth protein CR1, conserved region 1 [Rhizobium sp. NFR07]|uniref:stealth conserved region 3 domain-containing protein n=1 Tax=Rhizobium sp. NFR07 TaxID=1566262 RepID=UPI0008EA4A7D|nr:stealth conserved region 3 domain-containing protein [Rhizobium sp. NFR07]SFB52105.1 Stealth protein CR1, conserved region 1 [Rhizobium sp. NFR07]
MLKKSLDRYAVKLRDVLNARYPVTHMILPSRQAMAWEGVFEKLFKGRQISGPGDVLEAVNLNITAPASGDARDIDLAAASFPFIFEALLKLADSAGQKVYIYLADQKEWKDLTRGRFKSFVQKPTTSGRVELAIVDSSGTLIDRYSVALWKQSANFFHTQGDRAPVKRLRRSRESLSQRSKAAIIPASPIDVVYTWVNSSDQKWRELYEIHAHHPAADKDRFDQTDELRYSLRSIDSYAHWVSTIYILSNCEPPEWFVPSERVKWVMHEDVIPAQYLPTFNSHAIETFLHKIPGLSENFLYFNDDFFLADFVQRSDFFTKYGRSISRLEPYGAVPYLEELCAAGEAEEWQYAAVNGANLIASSFLIRPTQVHRHAPYAFKKSVFDEIETAWPEQLHRTRAAKFRTADDLSVASFLYHHFALNKGSAVEANDESMIVRHTNYRAFQSRAMYKKLKFFCVNDGGGSAGHVGFRKFKQQFLQSRYSFRSRAERPT